jgi:hypothetical protein
MKRAKPKIGAAFLLQRHILGNDLYDIILQPHLIHDLPRISHGIIPPSITVEKEVLSLPFIY